ncbi:MAG: Holliday junction resolvase RuvX [Patescibacteria group bacterium]
MKLLGVDWGERRIGFAVSPDGQWVFPWKVMAVRGFAHALETIQAVVVSERIEKVVLGLPLSLDGKDSAQTSRVREVAADLQHILTVPVDMVDERLTSTEATRLRQEAGKHGAVDADAATLILQSYLAQQA